MRFDAVWDMASATAASAALLAASAAFALAVQFAVVVRRYAYEKQEEVRVQKLQDEPEGYAEAARAALARTA